MRSLYTSALILWTFAMRSFNCNRSTPSWSNPVRKKNHPDRKGNKRKKTRKYIKRESWKMLQGSKFLNWINFEFCVCQSKPVIHGTRRIGEQGWYLAWRSRCQVRRQSATCHDTKQAVGETVARSFPWKVASKWRSQSFQCQDGTVQTWLFFGRSNL